MVAPETRAWAQTTLLKSEIVMDAVVAHIPCNKYGGTRNQSLGSHNVAQPESGLAQRCSSLRSSRKRMWGKYHATNMVAPKTRAWAQKPGKVRTLSGAAAVEVCKRVFKVANVMRPSSERLET